MRRFQRTAAGFLAAQMWLILCTPTAFAGSTLDRVYSTGTLSDVVVVYYPPFGFIDDSNELAGFDIDVARAMATRMGLKLKLSTPGWETIVAGHWRGRWDLCICSMSPTEERGKVLNFPAMYYSSPAVLVVHQNDNRIHTLADISGRRVGVGMGSSYENFANKSLVIPGRKPLSYPFKDVVAVPGDETINFRNLALGPGLRLDAVIADLATAQANIAATHALKIVGGYLYEEPNAIATDKGDPEWDALVARTIQEMRADGTLAQISQHWFQTDITRDGP
jgi:polar amino acid transport system substrate-binding protein